MKLHLGCGNIIIPGCHNVDILGDVDERADLRVIPWPWPDNSADEILMHHVLEHLPDTYAVMGEVCRVLRKGGRFRGQVPYGFSEPAMFHPQHCRLFIDSSFVTLADHFNLRLVRAELVSLNSTTKHKLRNLIPFRRTLRRFIPNMYDVIDFEFEKGLRE